MEQARWGARSGASTHANDSTWRFRRWLLWDLDYCLPHTAMLLHIRLLKAVFSSTHAHFCLFACTFYLANSVHGWLGRDGRLPPALPTFLTPGVGYTQCPTCLPGPFYCHDRATACHVPPLHATACLHCATSLLWLCITAALRSYLNRRAVCNKYQTSMVAGNLG